MCEICQNWARADIEMVHFKNKGIPLLPNHHPNCPKYNDSLIDVWKINIFDNDAYFLTENEAIEMIPEELYGEGYILRKIKMHKEIFDSMREFEGF